MCKYIFLCLCVWFAVPDLLHARQPQAPLNSSELMEVKRICVRIIGTRRSQCQPLFDALLPFVRDRKEFERRVVICSADCRESVSLRGGLTILFTFPNAPLPGQHFPGPPPKDPRYNYAAISVEKAEKAFFVAQIDDNTDEHLVSIATSQKAFLALPASELKVLYPDRVR